MFRSHIILVYSFSICLFSDGCEPGNAQLQIPPTSYICCLYPAILSLIQALVVCPQLPVFALYCISYRAFLKHHPPPSGALIKRFNKSFIIQLNLSHYFTSEGFYILTFPVNVNEKLSLKEFRAVCTCRGFWRGRAPPADFFEITPNEQPSAFPSHLVLFVLHPISIALQLSLFLLELPVPLSLSVQLNLSYILPQGVSVSSVIHFLSVSSSVVHGHHH